MFASFELWLNAIELALQLEILHLRFNEAHSQAKCSISMRKFERRGWSPSHPTGATRLKRQRGGTQVTMPGVESATVRGPSPVFESLA